MSMLAGFTSSKILTDFQKYIKTHDIDTIKYHTLTSLRHASYELSNSIIYADTPAVKALEQRIKDLEKMQDMKLQAAIERKNKKLWDNPLLVGVVSAVIGAAVGAFLGAWCTAKFAEVKQLTIPTTVADRYGNKLHLEEPVAHKGYYEYPIIIYDKANNYRRIDKYAYGKELGIKFEGE